MVDVTNEPSLGNHFLDARGINGPKARSRRCSSLAKRSKWAHRSSGIFQSGSQSKVRIKQPE